MSRQSGRLAAGNRLAVVTLAVLIVGFGLARLSSGQDRPAKRPPNVVVFVVDDLGCMDIGAYHRDTFYETPNVDRLAREGIRFRYGYTANPVCSPTRYSLMTGKYPTRVGATNFFAGVREARFRPAPLTDRMSLDEVTLAEALKTAGYRTAYFGKWHLGPTEEFWPERQGFDINIGGCNRGAPSSFFSPYRKPRLTDGPPGEYLTTRLADEAVRAIEQFRDEPFLVYLAFYTVHIPLQAPAEVVAKYEQKARRLGLDPRGQFADEEQVWPNAEPRRVRVVQSHPTYAAMVEMMDRAVGRVLDRLGELGLEDNTIVWFTSDNGGLSTAEGLPTSNLPLRGGKGWLYEGGIRVPHIVRWPGVARPGSQSDVPISTQDLFPTLLEAAGTRPPGEVDGASLVPVLRGGDAPRREALYWHYPHYSNQGGFPGGAIRAGDWKLIERFEDGRVHLYNIADDESERHDRAAEMPDRVRELRGKLHDWYREVGAKFLEPKPDGPQPWRPGA